MHNPLVMTNAFLGLIISFVFPPRFQGQEWAPFQRQALALRLPFKSLSLIFFFISPTTQVFRRGGRREIPGVESAPAKRGSWNRRPGTKFHLALCLFCFLVESRQKGKEKKRWHLIFFLFFVQTGVLVPQACSLMWDNKTGHRNDLDLHVVKHPFSFFSTHPFAIFLRLVAS